MIIRHCTIRLISITVFLQHHRHESGPFKTYDFTTKTSEIWCIDVLFFCCHRMLIMYRFVFALNVEIMGSADESSGSSTFDVDSKITDDIEINEFYAPQWLFCVTWLDQSYTARQLSRCFEASGSCCDRLTMVRNATTSYIPCSE